MTPPERPTQLSDTVPECPLTRDYVGLLRSGRVSGVVANFSEADPNCTIGGYTASINRDVGTVSSGTVAPNGGGFSVSGSHQYSKDRGMAIIKITITDVKGSYATGTTIAKE